MRPTILPSDLPDPGHSFGSGAAPVDAPNDWHAYRPFPNRPHRNDRQRTLEIPLLVRALGLPRGARILEFGCGRGIALPVLDWLLCPTRLVGIDIDAGALAEARAQTCACATPLELLHGDIRQVPMADGSVDIVIDFGTCYHISYPEVALREAARLLAPGGIFVEETRISQVLSHPVRSFGRTLPWKRVTALRRSRSRLLWTSYVATLSAGS
jgi:SAM-dependent methyltransferase